MKRLTFLCLIVLGSSLAVAGQMPKYGVTSTADKTTDFSKLKTYVWDGGWLAPDKNVHQQIQTAVDRELKALGLEKKSSGPSDVLLTYASLRRIDVDLNSKPATKDGPRRQFDVGTLVVLVLEPGTRKELYRARVDKPIEADPDKIEAIINAAVAEMFAGYPTRQSKAATKR